jgi:hypothetical protein
MTNTGRAYRIAKMHMPKNSGALTVRPADAPVVSKWAVFCLLVIVLLAVFGLIVATLHGPLIKWQKMQRTSRALGACTKWICVQVDALQCYQRAYAIREELS